MSTGCGPCFPRGYIFRARVDARNAGVDATPRWNSIWDGKYDKDGRRVAPVRVLLPYAVETVNESAPRTAAVDGSGQRRTGFPFAQPLDLGGQEIRSPSTCHDLSKLYEALPLAVRGPIEATYETAWRSRWRIGRRHTFTIAIGPPAPPPRRDNHQSWDLPKILARSKDTFQSFRYIWEYTRPPQGYQLHPFEYFILLCACEAFRATIVRRLEDTPGPD